MAEGKYLGVQRCAGSESLSNRREQREDDCEHGIGKLYPSLSNSTGSTRTEFLVGTGDLASVNRWLNIGGTSVSADCRILEGLQFLTGCHRQSYTTTKISMRLLRERSAPLPYRSCQAPLAAAACSRLVEGTFSVFSTSPSELTGQIDCFVAPEILCRRGQI